MEPRVLKLQKQLKQKHQAIILFEVGDYYEAIAEDAQIVADIMGTPIAKRFEYVLTGVLKNQEDVMLRNLTKAGHRVALVTNIGKINKSYGKVENKKRAKTKGSEERSESN